MLGVWILIFFILVRLPYLGFSNFNTDSFKWKQRIYDFGTGVFTFDFQRTNQKYHPGVTLLWIGTFSVKAHSLVNDYIVKNNLSPNSIDYLLSLNFYQILFVVVSCGLLYYLSYYYLSKIWDPYKAFIILFIVMLEPFFMGLTTTLHLDGLLSLLLVNSFLCFYLFLRNIESQKPIDFYFIQSAVFMGLALLTKTTAFLALVIIFLVYFIQVLFEYKAYRIKDFPQNFYSLIKNKTLFLKIKSYLFGILIYLLTISFIYFLLWPSMWVLPFDTLTTVYKGVTVGTDDHSQLFFGKLVSDPGPLFYLLVFLIKTPIYIFPAVLLALYIQLNTTYRKYIFEIFILMVSILFWIEVSIPSKKLDRYLLPAMVLISIAVLSYIFDKYKKWLWVLLLSNLFTIFYLRYDFFSYFSPIVWDNKFAPFWIEPKWAYGQKELVEFFKNEIEVNNFIVNTREMKDISRIDKEDNNMVVAFPEKYYTQLYPYIRFLGSIPVINDLSDHAKKANYFVFPVWENNSAEYLERYNLSYYGSIKVRGEETYKVYKTNVN